MKLRLTILVLFISLQMNAQLKIEQLVNDSLVKGFIVEQTKLNLEKINLMSEIKFSDYHVNSNNIKLIDTLTYLDYVISDFNKDGKKDMVVSYAEKEGKKKYYSKFNITAFLSNHNERYSIQNLWDAFFLTEGFIKRNASNSDFIIFSRPDYYYEKLVYDTLKYFEGNFINVTKKCNRLYTSLKFYTTSNWAATPGRIITVSSFLKLTKEEIDLTGTSIYNGELQFSFYDSLQKLICEINPEFLNTYYELQNVRDAGTFHLEFKILNSTKKINDYGSAGNFGLIALYKMLWRINRETVWTLVSTTKPDYKLKQMPGDN